VSSTARLATIGSPDRSDLDRCLPGPGCREPHRSNSKEGLSGTTLAVVDNQTNDRVELRDNVLIVTVGDRGLVFELDRPSS
jgi:hypothetical protein